MLLIESYLNGRKVSFSDGNNFQTFKASKGYPQGSVLGPLFWNVVGDQVLKKVTVTYFVPFANYLLLLEVEKSRCEHEARVNCFLQAFT